MPTITRTARNKFDLLEKKMTAQRDQLRDRIGGHRLEVVVDREPDDEAAKAYENVSQEMLVRTLERERRTLREIESALQRIKKGEYGICASCDATISVARLDALPWARYCIHCAESLKNPNAFRAAS